MQVMEGVVELSPLVFLVTMKRKHAFLLKRIVEQQAVEVELAE